MLLEVLEDGVVRDSVAGGARRTAEAALFIDLNRRAQADADAGGAEAPMRHLLSHVDVIVEIHADPERAWQVAQERYAGLGVTSEPLESAEWARELRLLVAALRDRHPTVDLAPVAALMAAEHNAIAEENAALLRVLPEAGDIPARLVNTFARLVAASARSNDRGVATAEDVAEARAYLDEKLKYFKLLPPDEGTPDGGRASLGRIEPVIRERFGGGRQFSVKALVKLYQEVTGEETSERTEYRWLAELGAKKTRNGLYVLRPRGGGK